MNRVGRRNPPCVALGSRLIGDPREALVAAEHGQHVENAGRGRAAGQRRAQRLGDGAELGAGRSA